MITINLCELAQVLNLAADLFEASPRESFTREEVARWLRLLPDELAQEAARMDFEEALAKAVPS
jgi:hypothetical protein